MKYRIAVCVLLTAVASVLLVQPGIATRAKLPVERKLLKYKKAEDNEDINQLALEVKALQGLLEFDPTIEQMEALQKLLKPSFISAAKRDPGKCGSAYRENLKLLRTALVENDEDDIDTYTTKVEVLEEDAEVDDDVKVPPPAWNAARDLALPLFTARQVLAHLDSYEEFPGPVSVLLDALEENADEKDEKEWIKERDAAARKIGWLAGGQIGAGAKALREKAKDWLDEKHKLTSKQLEDQQEKLEKEAHTKLFPKVGPLQVMTNLTNYDMAELLANPRFPAALAARIKAEKEAEKEAEKAEKK